MLADKFTTLLTTTKHELTKEAAQLQLDTLRKFGDSVAITAIEKYMLVVESPFFDWSLLVKLAMGEYRKQKGYLSTVEAWQQIQSVVKVGSGWIELPDTVNDVVGLFGREQFKLGYVSYQKFSEAYEKHIKEIIVEELL